MLINDAPIEHGSSGSPLLNEDGKLVGVAYAGDDDTGREYAVPVEVLADLIADTGAFSKDPTCEAPALSAIPATATACSTNVFAGPKTKLPFALSVEAGWRAAGEGSARFQAFSPVTKLDYQMRCQYGNPVVCRAQTEAIVYIRP